MYQLKIIITLKGVSKKIPPESPVDADVTVGDYGGIFFDTRNHRADPIPWDIDGERKIKSY